MDTTDYQGFFKGKRVTLMRLGLLGRGVGDAAFLAECGADVLVVDSALQEVMQPSIDKLARYPNIRFKFGPYDPEDFKNCDMVLKGAGAPLDSPEVAAARDAGVPVYMSTALFAKFAMEAGVMVAGVTGTRGKSTVSHMIHYVLVSQGMPGRSEPHTEMSGRAPTAWLAGNIRGLSTLAMLPSIESGDIVVLELDSWQLQGFGGLKISPQVAVFTNLLSDHLNYYPDMQAYFADKANIFKYQKPGDALFAGQDIAEQIRAADPPVAPVVPAPLPDDWRLQVLGGHNQDNAALAAAALRALGLGEANIKAGLESFGGVEGRLQRVASIRGVDIYNDNNATTPDATLAAIRALAGDSADKRVILIMGGSDKGLDMSALWQEVLGKCKDLYFLAGTGIDRIRPEAPHVPVYNSIPEVLAAAMAGAAPGDIILFSPAFASFGMFKNEYDRNDQFLAAVKAYGK